MYMEQLRPSGEEFNSSTIGMNDSEVREHTECKQHWHITDKIYNADGTVETVEHINVVVDACSKLLACLVKGENGYTAGNVYWAVGKGDINWVNSSLPAPSVATVKLLNEVARKQIASADISFLDGSNVVTASVTNKLQMKVTFLEAEANDEWREFGLFAGSATSVKDTGIMMNYKIHPLIFKTNTMRIERTIRITF